MNIVFDFDGTIANTTGLHKEGWKKALDEVNSPYTLGDFLEYKSNLLERYDSYQRLETGIAHHNGIREILFNHFNSTNTKTVVRKLFDLKESHTITTILSYSFETLYQLVLPGVIETIGQLRKRNSSIGVLSSSRKGIVTSFLDRIKVIDMFDFIVAEEDLYENSNLKDKPSLFPNSVVKKHTGEQIAFYVGDSYVDEVFARKVGCRYINIERTDSLIDEFTG